MCFDARYLFAGLCARELESSDVVWSTIFITSAGIFVFVRESIHNNAKRMEVDGMLAMVDWLGVPVEQFVRDDGS